jgi:hypothetical protein
MEKIMINIPMCEVGYLIFIRNEFPSLSSVLEKEQPKKDDHQLTKNDVEDIVKKFIEENRYIPQKMSFDVDSKCTKVCNNVS